MLLETIALLLLLKEEPPDLGPVSLDPEFVRNSDEDLYPNWSSDQLPQIQESNTLLPCFYWPRHWRLPWPHDQHPGEDLENAESPEEDEHIWSDDDQNVDQPSNSFSDYKGNWTSD